MKTTRNCWSHPQQHKTALGELSIYAIINVVYTLTKHVDKWKLDTH